MTAAASILQHLMEPLCAVADANSVEVCVNKPNEAAVRTRGQWVRREIDLSYRECYDIAVLAAALREQDVGPDKPVVGGDMPDGSRIQSVIPPCVPSGTVSLTFRRHSDTVAPLSTIKSRYDTSRWNKWGDRHEAQKKRFSAILEAYDAGDIEHFLREAVRLRFNLLFVGQTGAGKTTALNTVLSSIDPNERIITIENAYELAIVNQWNNVRLLYSHGDQGTANVSQGALLQACLRMRPGRILVGELRDPEAAYTYAEEACTGHRGSATTIHGRNAKDAVQRLFDLIKASNAGQPLDREMVFHKIAEAVDVIVPFEEIEGVHAITEVWLKPDAERRGQTIEEVLS